MLTAPDEAVKWWAQRGNSSVGRARPCQGRGRGFESLFPLQIQTKPRTRGFVVSGGGFVSSAGYETIQASSGRVAEWLCSGLQIRVRRFNSDLGLQIKTPLRRGFFWAPRKRPRCAGVPADTPQVPAARARPAIANRGRSAAREAPLRKRLPHPCRLIGGVHAADCPSAPLRIPSARTFALSCTRRLDLLSSLFCSPRKWRNWQTR